MDPSSELMEKKKVLNTVESMNSAYTGSNTENGDMVTRLAFFSLSNISVNYMISLKYI